MRKIVFTVTSDLTYDQRMDRICSALAEAGYSVTLVGRLKKDSKKLLDKHYRQERLRCFFYKGKFFYIEYNLRLFFYLLFHSCDIICSIDLDTILPGFWISRLRRKKFVYDAHEYFTEVIEVVHRPRIKRMWERIESYVLRRITYAYTVSEGLKREFEKKYPVRFEVIRNVPSLEIFTEPEKSGKYLIYIGVVNAGRGLKELIELTQEADWHVCICGEGDIFDVLVKKVKDLGLENRITFTGYLPPAQLRELTRKAYAGYLILHPDSLSYYYSLANKFFDYIHAGIPQVVVDFPEYRLLNEQYDIAVLSGESKESIKQSLELLWNDETLYQRLKQNTLKAREDLNWQKEAGKLIGFYEKIE